MVVYQVARILYAVGYLMNLQKRTRDFELIAVNLDQTTTRLS